MRVLRYTNFLFNCTVRLPSSNFSKAFHWPFPSWKESVLFAVYFSVLFKMQSVLFQLIVKVTKEVVPTATFADSFAS